MAGLNNDSIAILNEHLLKLMASEIAIFMILTGVTIFEGRTSINLTINSLTLTLHAVDILFLLSLLIVGVNIFNFYKKIICLIGEGVVDALISLFGMLFMFAVSLVTFIDELLPYRFTFILALSLAVLWKNQVLRKDFGNNKIGLRFEKIWCRQASLSSWLALVGALSFIVLFDKRVNRWWLSLIVSGKDVEFSPHYYEFIPGIFYLAFLLYSIRLFIKDGSYFASEEFKAEIVELLN